MYIYIYIYIYTYIHINMYTNTHMYMYAYIDTCIHKHTNIHTNDLIHGASQKTPE